MKKLVALCVLAALVFPAIAGADTIDIKVSGLVCDFCARTIEKAFTKTGKVEKIDVNLDKGYVLVETKPGETISDDQVRQLVTDSGYNTLGIERS